MDPSIFKAYDVRGVHGEQLDREDAYRVGRAFARVLSDEEGKPVDELRIGLGRDNWEPNREFPDHEPNPLLPGEPQA
jgi:phosphomannomutase